MAEVCIKIPKELEREFPKVNWSKIAERLLKSKLVKIARLKKALSKSKLTEKQAKDLACKINESLAKRYNKLLSKR